MSKEFVVNDSGKRESFDSGMVRDTQDGKILWHLINSGPMLKRYAVHLTKGAKKYGEDNWLKATGTEEYARFRASAFRHFMQWFDGDRDEDHAAAVIFNMNGAEYVTGILEAVPEDGSIVEENYCTAQYMLEGTTYYCQLQDAHAGDHESGGYNWSDHPVRGYMTIDQSAEDRKKRLWDAQGGEYSGSRARARCMKENPPRLWICDLPEGHDGRHSAPGFAKEDWD